MKHYYEFFANHRFGDDVKLKLFTNGWFSLSKKSESVEIYNDKAELKLKFNNAKDDVAILFNTGYVLVRDLKEMRFNVYYEDKIVAYLEIQGVNEIDFRFAVINSYSGACARIGIGNEAYFLATKALIEQGSKPEAKFHKTNKGYLVVEADIYGNIVYRGSNMMIAMDFEGKKIALEDVVKFRFTHSKKALIVDKKNCSKLISYEGLSSFNENNFSNPQTILKCQYPSEIRKLGKYAVIFEKALIADASTGLFLMEYESSDKSFEVTFAKRKIKPFVIMDGDKKAFYPRDFGECFEVLSDTVFVFYYDERFYPIWVDLEIEDVENALFNTSVDNAYAVIVSQAMFGKK